MPSEDLVTFEDVMSSPRPAWYCGRIPGLDPWDDDADQDDEPDLNQHAPFGGRHDPHGSAPLDTHRADCGALADDDADDDGDQPCRCRH